MRSLLAGHFSLAVYLMACTPDSSTPMPFETTPLALRAARQPTFGISAGIRLARATTIEGFDCGLGPAGITFDSRAVFSSSGNITLVCRSKTGEGPRPALVVKNELCGVFVDVTEDMHFVWTPSGRATLVCHLKN